jgi:hypothetical protein
MVDSSNKEDEAEIEKDSAIYQDPMADDKTRIAAIKC